jgi:predicted enzyme related to lactoylglutathione lyase
MAADHVSEDTDRAAKYYEIILGNGIESEKQEAMMILRRGEAWIASFTYEKNSTKSPQWTPVFVVDSLERIRGKVRELGGTVIVEEMPVPGSAISIFQDPVVGNYVTVMAAGQASA